jgi:hypothetical protein
MHVIKLAPTRVGTSLARVELATRRVGPNWARVRLESRLAQHYGQGTDFRKSYTKTALYIIPSNIDWQKTSRAF